MPSTEAPNQYERRKASTGQQLREALERLRAGTPRSPSIQQRHWKLNVQTLAQEAGVSRNAIYQNHREVLDELRNAKRTQRTTPAQRTKNKIQELTRALHEAQANQRTLITENAALLARTLKAEREVKELRAHRLFQHPTRPPRAQRQKERKTRSRRSPSITNHNARRTDQENPVTTRADATKIQTQSSESTIERPDHHEGDLTLMLGRHQQRGDAAQQTPALTDGTPRGNHMTTPDREDDEEAQFADPPKATGYRDDTWYRGARIPCTRDNNHEHTDPNATAVWALALGLAIGRHGAHWARSFARAIVRLHIAQGWLEVFLHEVDEPISAWLDIDDVFACFTQAWNTIAIEEDKRRWYDEQAVTLYAWDPAAGDEYGGRSGRWFVERDAMRSERMAAYTAGREAVDAARKSLNEQIRAHSADISRDELLLTASEVAATAFVKIYQVETKTELSLAIGHIASNAIAGLQEPWRGALVEAIPRAQQAVLEAHQEHVRSSKPGDRPKDETLQ